LKCEVHVTISIIFAIQNFMVMILKKYILLVLSILMLGTVLEAQQDPWTKSQLITPEALAQKLKSTGKDVPVILNFGVERNIKNAIEIGLVSSPKVAEKFKADAAKMDKKKETVIYCGCCTMENCPNVRNSFNKLKELGFKNIKVLNIPTDLNVDWIEKGYPMKQ
jgi:thiosulfate/3-mercaptopyruvate sulfurtransferase